MAQLERYWLDFVPCTAQRIEPQVEQLLTSRSAPIHREKHFVLVLQEVFKESAFERLKEEATKRGYSFFPLSNDVLWENGVVTITNLPVIDARFVQFTQDTYAKKGILYTMLDMGEGKKLGIANVHTGFSGTDVLNPTHLKQFQEIGEFLVAYRKDKTPFVVAGDFNAGPDMKYEIEAYPMAETIWHKGLLPVLEKHNMKWVDFPGVTWDNANPLISDPSFIIQLMNLWHQKTRSWGLSDSKMDHIFLSDNIELKSSELVLKEAVALECPGRMLPGDKTTLSDHYGVMALIKWPTKD